MIVGEGRKDFEEFAKGMYIYMRMMELFKLCWDD